MNNKKELEDKDLVIRILMMILGCILLLVFLAKESNKHKDRVLAKCITQNQTLPDPETVCHAKLRLNL